MRNNKRGKQGNGNGRQMVRFGPKINKPMGNPQSLVAPNELDVRLKFVDQVTSSSVGAFCNYNFNPNCPYDVDPAFGSTSTAGFAELAALYQFQRTIAYKYDIDMLNNSGNAAQHTIINTNVTPPASAYYGLAGNQFAQTKLAYATGIYGSITHFTGAHTVAQIVGSKTPETADSFASLTNNVPTDKIWLGLGQTDVTGDASAFLATIQLEMWIRFYERKNLSS